jgi:hypothetical protein
LAEAEGRDGLELAQGVLVGPHAELEGLFFLKGGGGGLDFGGVVVVGGGEGSASVRSRPARGFFVFASRGQCPREIAASRA